MNDPSLHTTHLRDCLQRMRAGDLAAREELLRAAGGRMERLARAMLRGFPNVRRLADTGDVYQDAVLRLLRTLRQIDTPPDSVRAFFDLAAGHIRRELLDLARGAGAAKRRGAGHAIPLDAGGSGTAPGLADRPEDPAELDRWCRFHQEAEKLPVEEREVFSLRFYHGWTDEDIAELFGVTERTVRRRWAAACARLSAALGGELPDV